jgi:crotonobetainyl-CoA:carnitine CoA-transferase CaiB-like acyl-CoA transferase
MSEQRNSESLLGGYRVLDLSDQKGVLCDRLFADMGADVIKIEPSGGDPMWRIGPFYKDMPDPGKSLYWFIIREPLLLSRG